MRKFVANNAMLLILVALCAILSLLTLDEQVSDGASAGQELAESALQQFGAPVRVVIIGDEGNQASAFAAEAERVVKVGGGSVIANVQGPPRSARLELERLAKDGVPFDTIIATARAAKWSVLTDIGARYPNLKNVKVLARQPYTWPNFLKAENLRNIANQIAIIAILAVGMTLVIITGGIDLSVGSMIALAAVVAALLVRDVAGGKEATIAGMLACAAAAIALCAALGLANGLIVTFFRAPPFIATLGMMMMASGLARLLSQEHSIGELPESAVWLGRETTFRIPNAVILMLLLYVIAHLVMSRTTLGRYIYAVGGNAEAARLSGVPVRRVLLLVYIISGTLAGLGGIVMTSLFQAGAPTYGNQSELYVVAAVVVGGTSISGGEGKVLGTLIGAFIIAVIQNGMNLLGVESAMQTIVLGAVIVAAVVLDRIKRLG